MKKILLLTALLVFCNALLPSPAFAHFAESDGNMTVTLHIDPNDDPIPGRQANLYFLFDDSTKRFQLEHCLCNLSISEEGRKLYQGQLKQKQYAKPSLWGTNVPFVFPEREVYHITLTGKPKAVNTFQPFTLAWDFRVDPDDFPGIVPQRPNDVPSIIAAVIGIGVFFFFFGWFLKKQILDSEIDSKQKRQYNDTKK